MFLYLSLSALHVSDSLVHHQERRVGAACRNWYKPVPYVWLLCGYNRKTARRMVPAYTNCDIQLKIVVPDDGLKSPKHVEHLMINTDTL